jgi:hypothetical protein
MTEQTLTPAPPDAQYKRVVVFDLDGTICDIEHRRHLIDATKAHPFHEEISFNDHRKLLEEFKPDWDGFYAACVDDTPKWPLIVLARQFFACGFKVFIVSGRSDAVAEQTKKWLTDHDVPFHTLLLRPAAVHTPDHELKQAWFNESGLRLEDIFMVFEDRSRVVKMWRELGLTCLQVCEGEF